MDMLNRIRVASATLATHGATPSAAPGARRRYDIEGLRTVAALLVATGHIWGDTVTGAVDVFFVVSAFFMTQVLLRGVHSGRVRPGVFLWNLLFRFAPLAWAVVALTTAVAVIVSPVTRWATILDQARAATGFFINHYLAVNSITYLGEEADASFFQHFWAIAAQVQVYLVLPFVVIACVLVARRVGWEPARLLFGVVLFVTVVSFVYALASVEMRQPYAYFDTLARVWEFGIGALVAITLPWLSLPSRAARALSWIGLATLLAFPYVVDGADGFPGAIATVPVLAAAAILIGGAASDRPNPVLTAPLIVRWAPYSFAFYLVHWPVLVVWRRFNLDERPGLAEGLLLIVVAGIIAWTLTRFVQGPLRARARIGTRRHNLLVSAGVVTLLGLTAALPAVPLRAEISTRSVPIVLTNPGAAVAIGDEPDGDFPELQPNPVSITVDQWEEWGQTCGLEADTYVEVCRAGNDSAGLSILAIGDSHVLGWMSVFDESIRAGEVRSASYFRAGCPLTTNGADKVGEDHMDAAGCTESNRLRIAMAIEERPDLVITVGNIARAGSPDLAFTDGFVDAVLQLTAEGIPTVVLRDQPRLEQAPSDCLLDPLVSDVNCDVSSVTVLADEVFHAALPAELSADPLVAAVDPTDLICFAGVCPATVGGVIPYIDDNHLTRDFVTTATPYFLARLAEAMDVVGVQAPVGFRHGRD